jgi:hypothetical protein
VINTNPHDLALLNPVPSRSEFNLKKEKKTNTEKHGKSKNTISGVTTVLRIRRGRGMSKINTQVLHYFCHKGM